MLTNLKKKENTTEDLFRKTYERRLVTHYLHGDGFIDYAKDGKIEVIFDNGDIRTYILDIAVGGGYIKIGDYKKRGQRPAAG